MLLLFLTTCYLHGAFGANMNQGGVPYAISNPPGSTPDWQGTQGTYSTDFESNVAGKVGHFDVYGEVQTKYSQVYWTRNNPIDLPPEIVSQFKGKVMAITGYEVDQVTHTGPRPGYTTTSEGLGGFSCYPDCGKDDKSVPIYNAYNHHYFSWLTGSDSEMFELEDPLFMPNPTTTAFRTKNGTEHGYPTNLVFKENPGGEFRMSYHGYPSGFAQLLHSPSQWLVEPMQIDTHNRNYSINEPVGYNPSFLPAMLMNNMTNFKNGLSPLIECPCSDRIKKTTTSSSTLLTAGTCHAPLQSVKDCTAAIISAGAQVTSSSTVMDPNLPAGCIMKPDNARAGLRVEAGSVQGPTYSAVFNTANSKQTCGLHEHNVALQGTASLLPQVEVGLEHNTVTAIITLTGPVDVWFGVGFNAKSMEDKPYAIIVDGAGGVTERKLANHGPGTLLKQSVSVVSNTEHDNVRTLVLHRRVNGSTADHYNFPTKAGDLNLIAAVGDSPQLAYHKARTGGKITLLPTRTNACVCQPTSTPYLTYMDSTTQQFGTYDCVDEPRSDMMKHGDGTGREVPNQACQMDTYHGGLQCCKHSWFLTDRDQDSLIPKDKVDTYYLKWRYYFQEYEPATDKAVASHRHLHHWVFLIDAQVNDYEEDNAQYGQESIGHISAHLKAKDIGLEDLRKPTDDGAPPVPGNFTTITPLVMTPHCHAPSCIRQEFWNADTGEIICNMTAMYGNEKYGSTNNVFNEKGYLTILPCIFGNQPGLQTPFNISPDTNITAIKYFNNTHRHLGQMAQWTGMMVYDTDPY
eukprot:GFUD01017488.1.p1 GENE.GFUD01017488.1~~GFUD01017488.1.p1  ORF type:complete len:796 (-),score=158.21 GFUD01017488.1:53-2440(-)